MGLFGKLLKKEGQEEVVNLSIDVSDANDHVEVIRFRLEQLEKEEKEHIEKLAAEYRIKRGEIESGYAQQYTVLKNKMSKWHDAIQRAREVQQNASTIQTPTQN